MQKRNHTPGPWGHYHDKLRPQFPTLIHEIHGPNGERVVTWGGFDGVDLPKQEIAANARLIAAAPELLDALLAYQRANRLHHDAEADLYETAKSAIEKATGGAQ